MKDAKKTMVLTGASRGIGHATVKRFSEAGWRIITCSRSPLHPTCPWDAGEENHLQIDLASPAEIESGARELIEKLDGTPLHALVNNAGISPKSEAGDRIERFRISKIKCVESDTSRQVYRPHKKSHR